MSTKKQRKFFKFSRMADFVGFSKITLPLRTDNSAIDYVYEKPLYAINYAPEY